MPKKTIELSAKDNIKVQYVLNKPNRTIPVRIGDSNNTIIYIREGEDVELAKQHFLSRLDPYNPARSKLIAKSKKKKYYDEAAKEKAALSYLENKKRSKDRLTFLGLD